MLCKTKQQPNGNQLIKSTIVSIIKSKQFTNDSNNRKMNNNYSDYLSSQVNNSEQYYNVSQPSDYFKTDLNSNLSVNHLVDSYNKPSNLNYLNNLPVNYYHENYSDSLNNSHSNLFNSSKLFDNSSIQNSLNTSTRFTQTNSRRLFHRDSIICSSMNDKNTLNGENFVVKQRPIDLIEELIANKTLFQTDLSTASPSICSNLNSSERNMITNSSLDDQENYSLYNSSPLSLNVTNNQSRQHSIFKRSSIINSKNDHANQSAKLMPIYENGRYQNPFPSWKDKTFFGTVKFLLTPTSINLPKNRKELDITLPVVKPMISSNIPDDKLRVSWIGHATVLVQFENATILTDPHFSTYSTPFKFGIKRYRPAPICVHELPENLNVVLISHNHYDHLDFDTVVALNKKYEKQINWFVPLGMKAWFTKLNIPNVIELNWWQEHSLADLNDLKIVALPSQHWSRRGLFDENTQLWASFAVIGQKFRYYFAGDTGYDDQIFKTIGEEYGPFNLASIPIGAYEPNNFLKFQHVNPKEAIFIHKDVKSNISMAIHWGTFPLSNEHYLDPPKKLIKYQEEENIPKDRFLAFEHGETRLINLDGTSKRENVNRYAK